MADRGFGGASGDGGGVGGVGPDPGSDNGGPADRGGRDPRERTTQPFEGEPESPETIAAVDFLVRQRRGFGALPEELAARRPRGSTVLTATLGSSPGTQITRRTLG